MPNPIFSCLIMPLPLSIHIFVKVLLPDSGTRDVLFIQTMETLLSSYISIVEPPSLRGMAVTLPDSQTAARVAESVKTLAFYFKTK